MIPPCSCTGALNGLLSKDFYRAMESGQLSEFDDGESPQFTDFLEWHGLYKVWLSRERAYEDLLRRQSLPALSFSRANLPFLIEEIEHNLLRQA
jgi:hypothetical protein